MKLVFLDETGASTTMTRTRGRAPKGERCVVSMPHGHWETTTFIAGLRYNDITGPMDGEAFLVYVRTFLCPTVHPGDIVIADNLPSHKIAGVRAAIEAAGAMLRYLPPYSPDLNPIEKLFSKLKPSSAKPPNVASTHSGMKSANCSNASHQKNVPTTSNHRDIMHD
jgi:transposase